MKEPVVNIKHQRRNSELKKVINSVVFSSKNAPLFSNIYITRLTLTKDTKDSTVFFAFLGDEEMSEAKEVIKNLGELKKEINLAVPKAMRLKFVPKVVFKLDEEYYKSKRIERIFEDIHAEEPSVDELVADETVNAIEKPVVDTGNSDVDA